MQTDSISSYLQQIIHGSNNVTANPIGNANSVSKTDNSTGEKFKDYMKIFSEDENNTSSSSSTTAMDLYKLYSTVTGSTASSKREAFTYDDTNATPLEVAQDAYSDLLEMEANAVSGTSSKDDSANKELEEYIENMQQNSASSSNTTEVSEAVYNYINNSRRV